MTMGYNVFDIAKQQNAKSQEFIDKGIQRISAINKEIDRKHQLRNQFTDIRSYNTASIQ